MRDRIIMWAGGDLRVSAAQRARISALADRLRVSSANVASRLAEEAEAEIIAALDHALDRLEAQLFGPEQPPLPKTG